MAGGDLESHIRRLAQRERARQGMGNDEDPLAASDFLCVCMLAQFCLSKRMRRTMEALAAETGLAAELNMAAAVRFRDHFRRRAFRDAVAVVQERWEGVKASPALSASPAVRSGVDDLIYLLYKYVDVGGGLLWVMLSPFD